MSEKPKRNSRRTRRKCLDYWSMTNPAGRIVMFCCSCATLIDAHVDHWEADHQMPVELGGDDEPPNVRPICIPCHKTKTHTQDRPRIQKAKNVRDKALGIKRPKSGRGFRRPANAVYDWKKQRYVRIP